MPTTDVLLVLAGVLGLAAELLQRHARRQSTDWQSIRLSLQLGALRFVTGLATQVLFVGALIVLASRFALWHLPAANPLVWIGFFLVNDLIDYIVHRGEHRLPFLWAAHVVHHSTEDYNLSAAARLSPVEAFYHPLIILWAPLFGVPLVVVAPLGLVSIAIGLFGHTQAIDKLGFLDRWIATPSAHRVHHGTNPEYIDKNFGSALMIWDRLFGTYEPEVAPVVFGALTAMDQSSPWRASLGGYPEWFSERFGMPESAPVKASSDASGSCPRSMVASSESRGGAAMMRS
jgi:alkylglycerol monooxygenase